MRSLPAVLLLLLGCSKPAPGLADGGGFMLPDGGIRDTGVVIPDSGAPDSGPFVCNPACGGGDFCGCLGQSCGCHEPRANNQSCDPQASDSCQAGLSCVRARRQGENLHVCSDGSDGTSCSHTQDVCTTSLACVCLTDPSSVTDCRCTESVAPNPALCDPMVPASCPGNACVRVMGPNGVYFVCSDGSEGSPCNPDDDRCRTTVGCSCPLVRGVERCSCAEPSGEGGPCDPRKPQSCVTPLMCVRTGNPIEGQSTVCSSGQPQFDGGIPCDPNNPTSCPPGLMCVEGPNGFVCV